MREGYYGWIGEVIVTGSQSPQVLYDTLIASPPHASIMLGDYTQIGFGCQEGPYTADTGITYTIALCVGVFGKPA
jgi:uncharacterized protein YkwD